MEDPKTPIKEYFAKVVKVFGMPGLVAIGYFLMNNWLEGYRSPLFITGGSATGKSSLCKIISKLSNAPLMSYGAGDKGYWARLLALWFRKTAIFDASGHTDEEEQELIGDLIKAVHLGRIDVPADPESTFRDVKVTTNAVFSSQSYVIDDIALSYSLLINLPQKSFSPEERKNFDELMSMSPKVSELIDLKNDENFACLFVNYCADLHEHMCNSVWGEFDTYEREASGNWDMIYEVLNAFRMYSGLINFNGAELLDYIHKCIICQSKVVDHDKVGLPF